LLYNLLKIITFYVEQSCYCALEGEKESYVIGYSPRLSMAKEPIEINSYDEFKRKSSGDLITKLTLDGYATKDDCKLLEPFFKLNSFSLYSEAIIIGENKGKAAELICKTMGVDREDSIAIGDSANDLDMLRFAGLGIAMGNASDDVKAAAGAITADCGKGGVAQALRKFVLSC